MTGTEIVNARIPRVDIVDEPANGIPFLILKSKAPEPGVPVELCKQLDAIAREALAKASATEVPTGLLDLLTQFTSGYEQWLAGQENAPESPADTDPVAPGEEGSPEEEAAESPAEEADEEAAAVPLADAEDDAGDAGDVPLADAEDAPPAPPEKPEVPATDGEQESPAEGRTPPEAPHPPAPAEVDPKKEEDKVTKSAEETKTEPAPEVPAEPVEKAAEPAAPVEPEASPAEPVEKAAEPEAPAAPAAPAEEAAAEPVIKSADIEAIVKSAVATAVTEAVEAATEPLLKRIKELEDTPVNSGPILAGQLPGNGGAPSLRGQAEGDAAEGLFKSAGSQPSAGMAQLAAGIQNVWAGAAR